MASKLVVTTTKAKFETLCKQCDGITTKAREEVRDNRNAFLKQSVKGPIKGKSDLTNAIMFKLYKVKNLGQAKEKLSDSQYKWLEQLAEHVKSYVSVTDKGVWKLEKNNQRTSGNSSSNTSDTPSATFSRSRFIIMLDMCRESDTVSAKAKKLAKQLAEELDK